MKIEQGVESAVRDAFAGAVAGEAERFASAIEGILAEGAAFLVRALVLTYAVDSAALLLIHDGQRPDDERLVYLARRFTEQESDWTDVDESVTLAYLTSLVDQRPLLDTPAVADAAFAGFALGGWLLSAFISADEKWTDFLDSILDALEPIPLTPPSLRTAFLHPVGRRPPTVVRVQTRIDQDIERAVRKAFAAAVRGETERCDDLVVEIAEKGDDFLATALTLVHTMNSVALHAIHQAQRPDDEQLEHLARRFTEQENEWADIDEAVTLSYLISLADCTSPSEHIPLVHLAFASFAIGGWLMSAFMLDGESWVDFMDALLDAVEATPAEQP